MSDANRDVSEKLELREIDVEARFNGSLLEWGRGVGDGVRDRAREE